MTLVLICFFFFPFFLNLFHFSFFFSFFVGVGVGVLRTEDYSSMGTHHMGEPYLNLGTLVGFITVT